jgi:hypothetical protein
MQGDYDNYPAGGTGENKANQSQTQPASRSEKKQASGTLPS